MVREMTRVYKKETDNLQDKKKLIQESCLESMVLLILYGEKEWDLKNIQKNNKATT